MTATYCVVCLAPANPDGSYYRCDAGHLSEGLAQQEARRVADRMDADGRRV